MAIRVSAIIQLLLLSSEKVLRMPSNGPAPIVCANLVSASGEAKLALSAMAQELLVELLFVVRLF
jgi:hypothetical protein